MTELKSKHFRVSEKEWEKFKRLTRLKGSNASVELRRYIRKYNEKVNENISSEKIDKELEEIKEIYETITQEDEEVLKVLEE